MSYLGSNYFHENYYSKNNIYRGGRLGCAITASTILADAGAMERKGVNPGVNAVERNLKANDGWISTRGYNPSILEPGDVIIWRRWVAQGGKRKETGRHIGIVVNTNPPEVVHNVFDNATGRASPKKTKIYKTNFISAALKPPGSRYSRAAQQPTSASSTAPGRTPGRAQQRPESSGTNVSSPELQGLEAASPAKRERANQHAAKRLQYMTPDRINRKLRPYEGIIREASQRYGVPVSVIKAIMYTESGGNPLTASHANAGGLMQMIPAAAGKSFRCLPLVVVGRYRNGKPKYQLDPNDDRADPYKNIMRGTELLAGLIRRNNGNLVLAAASYNAGSGNVKKYGNKVPPFMETMIYVRVVPEIKRRLDATA